MANEDPTIGAAAPPSAAAPPTAATPRRRAVRFFRFGAIVVTVAVVAGAIGWAAAGGIFQVTADQPGGSGRGSGSGGQGSGEPGQPGQTQRPTVEPTATPTPPLGGTELYGYLPYWQMNDRIAAYLEQVPVSTLALFSVSPGNNGWLRTGEIGYRRITGDRGRGLIADAHARDQRVELVVTSFGWELNDRMFGVDPAAEIRRERAVAGLLALVAELDVDGLNVDVEGVSGDISVGYASFLADLASGLTSVNPRATLSVATTASHGGAILARAAIAAGAHRVFLMGYEYHWSGSGPGASSPISNRDPGIDLRWSIADYVTVGVPRDRLLLGLPLYGMSWPVAGPDRANVVLGKGRVWIPSNNAATLTAPGFSAAFDPYEITDYFVVREGDAWRATYYDSPRSLRPKLELARSQGLAGGGFWALGYDYGLPGYLDLMKDFRAGRVGS